MNKKIWAILAPLLAYSNLSYGVTLEEALAATYKNNGNLKANQQNFLREIEKFPQALASFLPDVSANISTGNSKQKADVANSVSQTSGHSISKNLLFHKIFLLVEDRPWD
ncbi:MAG UNVERIFIED_CONTAM: hypothetical protein LVR18_03430 [Planctomycetaceae bacterium]